MIEVIVGNVGCVYHGGSLEDGRTIFHEYVDQSRSLVGRAGGEDVTLLDGEEIVDEYVGHYTRQENREGMWKEEAT